MTDKQLEILEKEFYGLTNSIENSYNAQTFSTPAQCIKWYTDAYNEIDNEEELQLRKYPTNHGDRREVYLLANRCRNGVEARLLNDCNRFNDPSFSSALFELMVVNNF